MPYDVQRIAIIGAGAMGSGVAAVLAQHRPVYLLNREPLSKAETGVENAKKAARLSSLDITPGTYEHDFERMIGEADFIYECLGEDPELKRKYLAMIDKYRKPDAITATSSSGLSIAGLVAGMEVPFSRRFLGVHPYNPPTKLIAVELVPGPITDPEAVVYMQDFMRDVYGRKVLQAADKPAYAGNRIGFQFLNWAAQLAEEIGVENVDYLFGGHTGRALAPLATIDLVGWDVHKEIVDNIYANTSDEAHETFRLPVYMRDLIRQGVLGDKTNQGFYRRKDGERLILDIENAIYMPSELRPNDRIEQARELIHYGQDSEALRLLLRGTNGTEYVRHGLLRYVSYAGMRNGEVADMAGINRVMGYGFNWAPPDVITDIVGTEEMIRMLEAEGLPVPNHIASSNGSKLYAEENDSVQRYFSAR